MGTGFDLFLSDSPLENIVKYWENLIATYLVQLQAWIQYTLNYQRIFVQDNGVTSQISTGRHRSARGEMKEHLSSRQKPICLREHHAITWCIFLCTFVCYVERMGFSIAFTELAFRAELSEGSKGKVLSSFFIGYAGMQIPGGWLSARYGGFRVLTWSFILWGLISLFLTPGTIYDNTTFITACRIGIGISQGLFIPASHTLLAQWIPVHERSRLVSLAMSGMYLGSAVALLAIPFIVQHLGPAAEFRCAGLISLAWVALWLSVGSDRTEESSEYTSSPVNDIEGNSAWGKAAQDTLIGNAEDQTPFIRGGGSRSNRSRSPPDGKSSTADVEEPGGRTHGGTVGSIPWGVMMQSSAIWAIIMSNFAFHYATYVMMNWLPTYFQEYLHVSLYHMGNVFKVMPYLTMFAASNAGGWLGTWVHVSRGMTIQSSRKLVNTLGFALAVVSFLFMPRATHWREGVLYTTMVLGSLGLCRGGWAVNHMDIAPRHAGVVMAIANGAGTMAGFVGVWLTGKILEVTGGPREPRAWSLAMSIVALVCLTALVAFLLLARGDVLFR